MTTDRVPDVVGEVIGWRAWRVIGQPEFPLLGSVTHTGMVWHPNRWTHATCGDSTTCQRPGERGIPGESCSCGLYAAQTRAQLVKLGYNREHDKPVFIGEVGFAGKVIPGSQGWRAEKGRIVRLFVPHVHFRWVEPLERLYRVAVVLDNTYAA